MAQWSFQAPPENKINSIKLHEPAERKFLSDKALAEETSKNIAQVNAFQGTSGVSVNTRKNFQKIKEAATKRAWEASWSPVKSLGMNIVMLYFSSASVGIFTVLIISYALINGVQTTLSVNTVFEPLESMLIGGSENVLEKKENKICSVITSYIIYKAANMGILPTNTGDFLTLIPKRHPSFNVMILLSTF